MDDHKSKDLLEGYESPTYEWLFSYIFPHQNIGKEIL
jgi:hypothetical protein